MVLASDRAAELVRMTRFFVESHATERIVPAAEVAEWVEKVLRETAHEELARAYAGYGERKRWAGEWLPVVDERAGSGAAAQLWDKARLARSLRAGLNIDNVR